MTVSRIHTWTLDDGAITNGLIKPAGSGLPRRITGAQASVSSILADNPYWLMGMEQNGVDRVSGQTAVTNSIIWTVADSNITGSSYVGGFTGSPRYLVPGWAACAHSQSAWSIELWFKTTASPSHYPICGSHNNGQMTASAGISVWMETARTILVYIHGGTDYIRKDFNVGTYNDGLWHHLVVTYDNSRTAAGIKLYKDGALISGTAVRDLLAGVTSAAGALHLNTMPGGLQWGNAYYDEWATYNYVLTQEQIQSHSGTGDCRARFTRYFPTAATVKSVAIPGGLHRLSGALANRIFLSVNGGVTRTEVEPMAPLNYAVSAGQTLTYDVELYPSVDGRAYLATALGEGPSVIYDEADPSPNITSIESHEGKFGIGFNTNLGTVAAPVSDSPPALQITQVTQPTQNSIEIEYTPFPTDPVPVEGGTDVNIPPAEIQANAENDIPPPPAPPDGGGVQDDIPPPPAPPDGEGGVPL